VCGVTADENELNVLEIMHRYVESLDTHIGNVCFSSVSSQAFSSTYRFPGHRARHVSPLVSLFPRGPW
jgi:hypothetical protein